MKRLYFNEFERFAAAWLKDLWPEAVVDQRSITDVAAADVQGFERVHLFGGIGGWEYALELAGWPVGREVWTGSCPCQPFSSAGKRKGTADKRHLWPEMRRLVTECRPATIFGEQVASKDGREWLAGVLADLEALGYACGAADLCAAGVGAPHIRQRLFWVADSDCGGCWAERQSRGLVEVQGKSAVERLPAQERGSHGGLADLQGVGFSQRTAVARGSDSGIRAEGSGSGPADAGSGCRLANSEIDGGAERHRGRVGNHSRNLSRNCRDGKARRIESGLQPLAHGVPNRVGRLRGYGNAIVPQVAAAFVKAFLDSE